MSGRRVKNALTVTEARSACWGRIYRKTREIKELSHGIGYTDLEEKKRRAKLFLKYAMEIQKNQDDSAYYSEIILAPFAKKTKKVLP